MLFTIIVPARYASTRLPGKSLEKINGKPMIQLVYEACKRTNSEVNVIIATDHHKIKQVAENFGAQVVMTSENHVSGTDRCAEVAIGLSSDYIINVQGDEPFINEGDLQAMIQFLSENENVEILTLFHRLEKNEVADPNKVKLVKDVNNRILYFSRSLIPFPRTESAITYYKHVGVYAFKRATLLRLKELASSPLEISEGLEQLRWLENGYQIYGLEVEEGSLGIDTPEDLEKARSIFEK